MQERVPSGYQIIDVTFIHIWNSMMQEMSKKWEADLKGVHGHSHERSRLQKIWFGRGTSAQFAKKWGDHGPSSTPVPTELSNIEFPIVYWKFWC